MKITKNLIGASWLAAVLISLLSPLNVLAASASMSLSSAGSVSKGSNITVSIRENSGAEPVNAAKATLSYPTAQLQFVSISSSSAFTIVAANSGGGGSVNVDRGALPAVSGSQTIASVTFKALTDTGSAAVNITGGQVISANSNSDISAGKTGTTISFHAPAAPTPAAPAPPKDTTPPTITAVSTSDIATTSAVINWTTSEPATSEISYGPTSGYGLVAVEAAATTTHKVTLNSLLIQPGITYHYSIKSTDPSGNSASSQDATFATKGAQLTLTVKNQKNKPVSGAKIEVENQTATTNSQGIAVVNGLSLGKKGGTIIYKGDKYPFSADVTSADKPNSATVQINIKPNYTLPVILLVIVLLVIDYALGWMSGSGGFASRFIGRMRSKLPGGGGPKNPPASSSGSGASGPVIHPSGK